MRRRKSTIFFVVFGICLILLAIALNVGWILLNLQEIVLLVLGIIFFAFIITGLVLNTTFLVREIRRNEQQNAFLNAMTHELKTPIASIRLYLETIKSRDLTEEKKDEFYDIMLADSDRLLQTVEQVLQASRTREKSRSLKFVRINLHQLLVESTDIIISRYKLNPDQLKLAEIHPRIWVSGDPNELKTVFTNLLDNAVKYSPEDRIEVVISARQNTKSSVDIFVKDRGIGIPGTESNRVFKRFYRVEDEASKNAKGTGLGLYIVQSILKKHGGKIVVKSAGPGEGSTFAVRLPTAEEDDSVESS